MAAGLLGFEHARRPDLHLPQLPITKSHHELAIEVALPGDDPALIDQVELLAKLGNEGVSIGDCAHRHAGARHIPDQAVVAEVFVGHLFLNARRLLQRRTLELQTEPCGGRFGSIVQRRMVHFGRPHQTGQVVERLRAPQCGVQLVGFLDRQARQIDNTVWPIGCHVGQNVRGSRRLGLGASHAQPVQQGIVNRFCLGAVCPLGKGVLPQGQARNLPLAVGGKGHDRRQIVGQVPENRRVDPAQDLGRRGCGEEPGFCRGGLAGLGRIARQKGGDLGFRHSAAVPPQLARQKIGRHRRQGAGQKIGAVQQLGHDRRDRPPFPDGRITRGRDQAESLKDVRADVGVGADMARLDRGPQHRPVRGCLFQRRHQAFQRAGLALDRPFQHVGRRPGAREDRLAKRRTALAAQGTGGGGDGIHLRRGQLADHCTDRRRILGRGQVKVRLEVRHAPGRQAAGVITHSIVTYLIEVNEDSVRAALVAEALDRHGLRHEGKTISGATHKVTFDGRRGGGTYTIHITRDISKSGQAQLPGPGAA